MPGRRDEEAVARPHRYVAGGALAQTEREKITHGGDDVGTDRLRPLISEAGEEGWDGMQVSGRERPTGRAQAVYNTACRTCSPSDPVTKPVTLLRP